MVEYPILDILPGMNAEDSHGAQAWHGALPESLRWVPVAGGIVASLTRAEHTGGRLEAITSRPMLLAAVGKAASHAGQTTLYLTSMHARIDTINQLFMNIHAALQHVRLIADQFKDVDRWGTLLQYVSQKIAPRIDAQPACHMLPATG